MKNRHLSDKLGYFYVQKLYSIDLIITFWLSFLEGLSVTRTDMLFLKFLAGNLNVNSSQGSKPMVGRV